MYSYGPPHMAAQKQDDQHEHTFSSYVRIQDVVLKTCLGRWTIGRSGERGSGISVLPARHDDDDYAHAYTHTHGIYIYISIHRAIWKGATLFPGLLHFTLDPYHIILCVKRSGIMYHFLSFWYDTTLDWNPVSRTIGEQSTH